MSLSIFEEISNKRVEGYTRDPDSLTEHAKNESAIVGDYKGRVILELLQQHTAT